MNQASIFTLDKDAKGYKDFEDLPSDIYVDTSAWICAYGSENESTTIGMYGQRRGRSISEFMKECAGQGVTLYHSNLVINEAIHVNSYAYMDYVAENNNDIEIPRFKNKKINYKKLREIIVDKHPSVNEKMLKSRNNLIDFIKESSVFLAYEDDEEYLNDVLNVIDSTKGILDTQDAKHVCIARSYGINSFLTSDGDFIYLDNDNVFTVSNEKYAKEKIGRSNILLPYDENKF